MTDTMEAVVHDTFGAPEEVLHLENRPVPEPGPGQVRVRVILSPIHNHDLWTVRGTYGFIPDLPSGAGTEALGVVDALGPGVEGLVTGQRVATGSSFGIWARYAVIDAAAVVPVPEGLSDESAAQLVSMPFSALSLLDHLDLQPGDWLVQNSANGAVGRNLAQLAAARGVHVLGLVRRQSAVDQLAELGIDGIVATDGENWRDRAAEVTGGAPVVAALDSVGGPATADLVSLLADGGDLVSFGAMGSPVMEVPNSDVIFRGITVRGFWGSRVSREMDPAKKASLFGELIRRVLDGQLALPVADIFDAARVADAVKESMRPGRTGKTLLRF
ncbi:zinc-binding dehydrogenase [Corynebacterium neomassiliense]|uniref:zinc-binding dehydrogenase n=1 Tax=Corynebacterium neomassiliense TaxID=2079482 RepID=UPI001F173F72|nr:zinc-binding dehydrogenase [Corynebacterium neomassiliense]